MRSRIYHLICRDPTRLNVSCLQSLTQLELVGCDLSISAWLGLEMVQPRLRALTCRNSLEELWHLLAPSLRRNGNHGRAACSLALQIAASCGRMMQIWRLLNAHMLAPSIKDTDKRTHIPCSRRLCPLRGQHVIFP